MEIEKLKADLRRKLITKQDFSEQLKKLPLSEIIEMARVSLQVLNSQETIRQYQFGQTYQYKMKFILSWLKKLHRPTNLSKDELILFDSLNNLESDFLVVDLSDAGGRIDEEEEEVVDSNLIPPRQKSYEKTPTNIIIRNEVEMPTTSYNPLKRKFVNFNLHNESLRVEYDTTKKIRKTVYRQEETPIPTQWKPWSAFLMEPIFLIQHATLKPDQIRDNIIKAIEEGTLAPIIGTFITGNEALRIKAPDNLTRKSNMEKLKNWLPELKILKPKVFDPKIRLVKVKYDGSLTDIDGMRKLIDNIWSFSELKEAGNYTVESAFTSTLIDHIDIIITVSPSVRDKIHDKRGVIYYLGNEIKITDYFKVSTCSRCFSFQHREKKCQAQQCCKYCSLLHNWRECPINNKPDQYCCVNCKKNSPNHKHAADDWDCPTFQKKLRESIQLINYEYRWIMRI